MHITRRRRLRDGRGLAHGVPFLTPSANLNFNHFGQNLFGSTHTEYKCKYIWIIPPVSIAVCSDRFFVVFFLFIYEYINLCALDTVLYE